MECFLQQLIIGLTLGAIYQHVLKNKFSYLIESN